MNKNELARLKTNGEVLHEMFPQIKVEETCTRFYTHVSDEECLRYDCDICKAKWLNAIYKKV